MEDLDIITHMMMFVVVCNIGRNLTWFHSVNLNHDWWLDVLSMHVLFEILYCWVDLVKAVWILYINFDVDALICLLDSII
jgi:hypothetical protein